MVNEAELPVLGKSLQVWSSIVPTLYLESGAIAGKRDEEAAEEGYAEEASPLPDSVVWCPAVDEGGRLPPNPPGECPTGAAKESLAALDILNVELTSRCDGGTVESFESLPSPTAP